MRYKALESESPNHVSEHVLKHNFLYFFLVVRSIVPTIKTFSLFPRKRDSIRRRYGYTNGRAGLRYRSGSLWAYAQILNSMLQSRDSGELFRRLAWADMNSPNHKLSGYFSWGFGTSTPFWLRQRIAFRSDTFFGTRTLTVVRFREDADSTDA